MSGATRCALRNSSVFGTSLALLWQQIAMVLPVAVMLNQSFDEVRVRARDRARSLLGSFERDSRMLCPARTRLTKSVYRERKFSSPNILPTSRSCSRTSRSPSRPENSQGASSGADILSLRLFTKSMWTHSIPCGCWLVRPICKPACVLIASSWRKRQCSAGYHRATASSFRTRGRSISSIVNLRASNRLRQYEGHCSLM
jgi:hypothetical protein